MTTTTRGKHLLSIADLSVDEVDGLIRRAADLKGGPAPQAMAGKSAALLFEKPSLRTKVSFDVAVHQLGGHPIYMGRDEVGMGVREPVSDTARILSRYVSVIIVRTFAQSTLETLAQYSSVPVINALSDDEHPCQALADLLTVYEKKGRLKGTTIAYIGDGNNVAVSLALGAASVGANFTIASPAGYGDAGLRGAGDPQKGGIHQRRGHAPGRPKGGGQGRGRCVHGRLDEHGAGGGDRAAGVWPLSGIVLTRS